ncbi:transmembrane transporter [Rhizophagus clarus]|uniref:Transmembrane transporter n=1 Tax=Rhizophagus clarus TaxID=94130 RepID=A0A8H3QDU9_9GLOM|nr:transmembrane transporter [Rhizophagus clarus]
MFHALSQGDELSSHYDEDTPGRIHGQSTVDIPNSQTEPDENTHLLQRIRPSRKQVYNWTQIHLKFCVLPVAVVLAWCAIPVPYNDPYDDSDIFSIDHIKKRLLGHYSSSNDTESHLPDESSAPVEINFWFFLFYYYGIYNAIALLMITKIFDLYSLNWWPKWLGGLFTYCVFWLMSLFVGVLIYLFTGLEKYTLTWVLLTFITMNMPLLVAFIVIRSQNRNTYRHSLTILQKTFLERQLEYRIPASYVRFLWFCTTLSLVIAAFIAGEAYAHVFLTSPETHSGIDAFIYVYSWLATIYILDTVTEYIIETRVKSDPLQFIFKLYFFMIYFIFYRNLFARLRDREQYILIQAASSLWVCIFYPLCMTRKVHEFLVNYFGIRRKDYNEYQKYCGRSFFIRNLAENVTMLGFICWIYIIHNGPNSQVYPYFNFEDDNAFDFALTLHASCVMWAFELASSAITRTIYKKVFNHNISREAMTDIGNHPKMVFTMIVIMIHVLQDIQGHDVNVESRQFIFVFIIFT